MNAVGANGVDAGAGGEALVPEDPAEPGNDATSTPPHDAETGSRRRRGPVIDLRGASTSRTPFG
jgi:hypothetical protein